MDNNYDDDAWSRTVVILWRSEDYCILSKCLGTSGDPRSAIRIRGDADRAIQRSSRWEMRGDRSSRIRVRVEFYSVQ
jgi:hypothetical protein